MTTKTKTKKRKIKANKLKKKRNTNGKASSNGNGKKRSNGRAVRKTASPDVTDKRNGVPDLDTEAGDLAELCLKIKGTKRMRDMTMKSRIMIENRLGSCAASILGYESGMDEKQRKKHWTKAKALSTRVLNGLLGDAYLLADDDEDPDEMEVEAVPTTAHQEQLIIMQVADAVPGVKSFRKREKMFCAKMSKLVTELPVFSWATSFRGVSNITLANVIGETGDLSNYLCPARVWKRMGCAPFKKNDEVHAGRGWMIKKFREQTLTKQEWEEFGYCPKRRSVVYNLAKMMKMACRGKNAKHDGGNHEFMQRYEEAKLVAMKLHPKWTDGHLESHGLLLCGKRYLRQLWIEWNKDNVELMASGPWEG